jgi:hypothetical protein
MPVNKLLTGPNKLVTLYCFSSSLNACQFKVSAAEGVEFFPLPNATTSSKVNQIL